MANWSWELQLKAEKNLADFNTADNFDLITPISLKGEFKEFFKFRIGDIRVFYKINWKTNKIIICYIAKRDRAYQ